MQPARNATDAALKRSGGTASELDQSDRDALALGQECAASKGQRTTLPRRPVERRAYTVSYRPSAREAELYEAVTHHVREEMNRADSVGNGSSRRRNTVGFALPVLQRRLASSPAAIHESLRRRLARLERRLEEV